MIKSCLHPLLLLCLTALAVLNVMCNNAEVTQQCEQPVQNLTNNLLRVIPPSDNSFSVTKLLLKRNLITLTDSDRLALATYTNLTELHLDDNLVKSIAPRYFCVVPHLTVMSLSMNNISSLDPEAFSGLNVLRALDLSSNQLTRLPQRLLHRLKALQVLNLQGNPWNCSCELLQSIREVTAAGVSFAAPHATCASPHMLSGTDLLEATALCFPSSPSSSTNSPEPVAVTEPRPTLPSILDTSLNIDHSSTPVLGNTWKFTVCVAALAVATSVLIVCAVKGPSWYKLFYNYRHQRLQHANDAYGDDIIVSTVASETGRRFHHHTYRFQQGKGKKLAADEEGEDEYFEDPYVKREE